ncbi:hypothetical protein NMG60_11028141 [Bertholletia excelsa]
MYLTLHFPVTVYIDIQDRRFRSIPTTQYLFLILPMETMDPEPSLSSPSLPSSRWWSRETVVAVTGANKGIGFALVKRFAELGLTVILTARDYERGKKAVESLWALGFNNVHFSLLDVSDQASIKDFTSWFTQRFQALDVLVNNAAVSFNELHENSVDYAETVLRTNFYGPKLLTEALLPFFRHSSASKCRILNISSRLGHINKLRNPGIKQVLVDEENLSEEQVEKMVSLFLESVKRGTWKSQGWPQVWTDYAVSKLALNAYSKVLARRFQGSNLSVNCFCPGFTQTSMTRGMGTRTADEAAETAATIALLPSHQLPTGKFYMTRTALTCSNL